MPLKLLRAAGQGGGPLFAEPFLSDMLPTKRTRHSAMSRGVVGRRWESSEERCGNLVMCRKGESGRSRQQKAGRKLKLLQHVAFESVILLTAESV